MPGSEKLESITRRCQQYLNDVPLVVLGSGSSIDYGIPSMSDLAIRIKQENCSDAGYDQLVQLLNTGVNLESAMTEAELNPTTFSKVQEIVWNCVNGRDIDFFWNGRKCDAIAQLLSKLLDTCDNACTIITTNYDRVIEYAADSIRANTCTGFEGNLVKLFERPSGGIKLKRIRARNKSIYLWKVHGSLDWFRMEETNEIVSYPLTNCIPSNHIPLIIPPGKEKMRMTHEEPYRTVIHEADMSIEKAASFFCVGYGFNDEHVQPKIITQIKSGKPIVVLARTMSENCRKLIVDDESVLNYIVFEQFSDGQTKLYTDGEEEIIQGDYWQLSSSLKLW